MASKLTLVDSKPEPAPPVPTAPEPDDGKVWLCIRDGNEFPDVPVDKRAAFTEWWNANQKHWFAPRPRTVPAAQPQMGKTVDTSDGTEAEIGR